MSGPTDARFDELLERLRTTESERDEAVLRADLDPLTSLLTLAGILRRTGGRNWGCIVVVDLDHFKAAQDSHEHGHVYGDEILREFATFLAKNTRAVGARTPDTMLARTGGDEFLLWTETRDAARRLRDLIREWHSPDGRVTASAGMGPDRATADANMYAFKREHRAR